MLISTSIKNKIFKMLIMLVTTLALVSGIYFVMPKQSKTVSAETTGSSATLSKNWKDEFNPEQVWGSLVITNDASRIEGLTPVYDGDSYLNIAEAESANPIYVYTDGNEENLVLYVDVETIYAPVDSSYLFGNSLSAGYVGSCSSIIFENFNTSRVTNMKGMFQMGDSMDGHSNLTSLDLSNFDTTNVTDMSYMFGYCRKLTSITFGSKFNTSKVEDMSNMFAYCEKLTTLDVSKFNTSKVKDMSGMFNGCDSLTTLSVSNFDTSKVENMNGMFGGFLLGGCASLNSLDLSNFDTRKVKDMGGMFAGCSSLTTITFGNYFNTSSVTNMAAMFWCTGLSNLDLSNFNTSQVTNMSFMFDMCFNLETLNVSSFDTSKVKNMMAMFGACNSLNNLDLSNFDLSALEDSQGEQMFASLVGDGVTNSNGETISNLGPKSFIAPSNLNNFEISLPSDYTYTGGGDNVTNIVLAGKTHIRVRFVTLSANWLAKVTTISPSSISSIKFTSNSSAISGFTKGENVADASSYKDLYYYYKSSGSGLYDVVVYTDTVIYAPAVSYLLFTNRDTMQGITNCTSLVFDNFNTSNATYMAMMFCGCGSVTNLDISGFNFDSVDTTTEEGYTEMLGMSASQYLQLFSYELEDEALDDYINAKTNQERVQILIDNEIISADDAEDVQFELELLLTNFSKIIAPATIPSGLEISLPGEYNYTDASWNVTSTEVLVAGATHISPSASNDTNNTGIILLIILLSLIALCFVYSIFMMLKNRKNKKKSKIHKI